MKRASRSRTAATHKPKRSASASLRVRSAAGDKGTGAATARRAARQPVETPSASTNEALNATAKAIGRTVGKTAAAIAQHLPWTGRGDGLDLLERDHRELEALLKQGTETNGSSGRKAILDRITQALTVHELMEEKVLYPVLKSHAEAKDIVLEGYQEHHVADVVVTELHQLPPTDERWGAKLKVLKENIEHHIEEEEGEMFKTARSILTREQLEDLGARMQAMKDEAQRRGKTRSK